MTIARPRRLAWVYTAGFPGIFIICHTPGLSDTEGRLFGLFTIDPIDDIVHLFSGIVGLLVASLWTAAIAPIFSRSASRAGRM
jgi:hypothetical protein